EVGNRQAGDARILGSPLTVWVMAETAGGDLLISAAVSDDIRHRRVIAGKPIRGPVLIANLSDGERGSAAGQLMLSRVRRRCGGLAGRWRGRSWRIRPGRTRRRGEAVRPRRRCRGLLLRGDDSGRDNECQGERQNDEFPHRSPSILFGLVLACTPYTS